MPRHDLHSGRLGGRFARLAALAALGALVLSGATPAGASRGGPDAAGYTWRDDREPGVVYERFDFLDPPTDVFVTEPGPDGSTPFIALPFPFTLYGRTYTSVSLSSDGWMSFARALSSDPTPSPILDPDGPPAMIAPLWEDLSLGLRGGGDFLRYEAAPDKIVFEWFRTQVVATGEDATFQVWLFPDGRIRFQYLNVAGAHPGATIGIEEETLLSGLPVMTNGVGDDGFTVRPRSVVEFVPPSDADCSGTIACGASLLGSVRRNPDRISAYGACATGQAGAEVVSTLSLTELSHVVATLSQGAIDNDLFLMPACEELECLATGDLITQDFLPPGDYVLAVDEPTGNGTPFQLDVACTPALVAASCGSNPASLDPAARIASWPCLPGATPGGERFFGVTLPAASDLVALTGRSDLAVVITPLAGFPVSAPCLSAGWGSTWATELPAGDYVVAVDSAAGAAPAFTLDLQCTPPRERAVACGTSVSGTLAATGSLDGWTCGSGASLPGGEDIHVLTLTALATLTLRLRADAPAEILLTNGAMEGPSACLARGDTFLSYPNAPPGRYAIVVDSVGGASYALDVACGEPVGSTCTPWEWHDGDVPITGLNAFPRHGDASIYELATPPPADDPGWKPAPDPATIGYARASDICGHACLTAVDFTYFRSYVYLPRVVTTFQISFGRIDDGVEVRLNGQVAAIGYLGRNVVVDLATSSAVRPGELNEILLVQEDDCCTWNELSGSACVITGIDPPCSASLSPPPPVDGLPGDRVTLAPSAADVSNCYDVAEYRWRSGGTVLRDWDPDPSYVHVLGFAPETLTVEVRCRRDAACTASGDVPVTVPACTASVTADGATGCPGTAVPLSAASWDLRNCPDSPDFRWSDGGGVLRDWDPADAYDHVVGPAPESLTLEVRCPSVPSCSASTSVAVAPPGDPVLPLVSPWLRVRKDEPGETPLLFWPGAAVPAVGGHFHVRRATDLDHAFVRVNADADVVDWTEPDPGARWLLFYDVRSSDTCERESAD